MPADTAPQKNEPGPSRIACVMLPRFNMMGLVSLLEPMRIANYLSPAPLYRHELHSVRAGKVTASNGMTITCTDLPEKLTRDDLVVVAGSWGTEHYADPALLSWLRRQARMGIRLCAVEIASYVFARAGLLAGRQATTHWSYLAGFQEKFPEVFATEQLFTIDGKIMTCAGSTSATDLMLHLIRADHGEGLVGEISDNIMHHPMRPSDAPQRKTLGRGAESLPSGVAAAIDLIEANISEPLPVPEIARQVGISQRQLERQFNQAMGCSVVQFGLLLRLQHARVLLISTDLGVREISAASGFNSLSHFAYTFRKCFGRRPSEYRQAWPEQEDAPTWPGTLSKYLDTFQVNQRMRGRK
ncbi:GlxA family transcriptional regulator [Roseovarius sp. E0-M6]|uniref:GlxA family transcriptional regulator n=1 Tax=Roseovarius sp. E0-M6 TaxID=3127118 RepID=UPI00301056F0